MATWTSIANSAVDAGSPIDEALVTALRDNPTALAEGASGAPEIEKAALIAPMDTIAPLCLLQTDTLTSGSTVNFTPSNYSDFSSFVVVGNNVSSNAIANVTLQIGTGATPTWQTGSIYHKGGTNASFWLIGAVSPATEELEFFGEFHLVGVTGVPTIGSMVALNRLTPSSTPNSLDLDPLAAMTSSDFSSLRLQISAGSFDSGTVKWYGRYEA